MELEPMSNVVVVQGAQELDEVPGLEQIASAVELRFAHDEDSLKEALPGADILLGWQFAINHLQTAWPQAKDLRWIQWCGAGVDALLFEELVDSDVIVSNMHGVFDEAMAEYALTLILAFAKSLPQTLEFGRRRYWQYRETEMISGRDVVVVGAGGIGRQIARTLKAVGMNVTVVGRHARVDPEFGAISSSAQLASVLPPADYVILILPETDATRGILSAELIATMKSTARLVNLGRGSAVDETALIDALSSARIAGAALDVFTQEPVPTSHPFWTMDNVIVSPHMSGDVGGYKARMVQTFIQSLKRFQSGQAPLNIVDKALGFMAGKLSG